MILKWGSGGVGNGQFRSPAGVAVDSVGNVYVTDKNNHRIQKFDSQGNFITKWGRLCDPACSNSLEEGHFFDPWGIAIDLQDNVFISDRRNHRIQKFDSQGNFITKWGTMGEDHGQFNYPTGIAVDDIGNVYVGDQSNKRIQIFDSAGNFILEYGTGTGGLNGIDVDGAGNIYVSELLPCFRCGRILKFSAPDASMTGGSWQGVELGQLNPQPFLGYTLVEPYGITIDKFGHLYVTDFYHGILKYDVDAFDNWEIGPVRKWGAIDESESQGNGDGQFTYPTDVAVDRTGTYIYVVDMGNDRIQKFASGN